MNLTKEQEDYLLHPFRYAGEPLETYQKRRKQANQYTEMKKAGTLVFSALKGQAFTHPVTKKKTLYTEKKGRTFTNTATCMPDNSHHVDLKSCE